MLIPYLDTRIFHHVAILYTEFRTKALGFHYVFIWRVYKQVFSAV
jgi:hypothetical protein